VPPQPCRRAAPHLICVTWRKQRRVGSRESLSALRGGSQRQCEAGPRDTAVSRRRCIVYVLSFIMRLLKITQHRAGSRASRLIHAARAAKNVGSPASRMAPSHPYSHGTITNLHRAVSQAARQSAASPVASWLLLRRWRRRRTSWRTLGRVAIRRRRSIRRRHHVAIWPRLAAVGPARRPHLCAVGRVPRSAVRARRRLRGVSAAVGGWHPVRALRGHAPPGRAAGVGVRALRGHPVLQESRHTEPRCEHFAAQLGDGETGPGVAGGAAAQAACVTTPSVAARCCE
jgi:hypothetical protein